MNTSDRLKIWVLAGLLCTAPAQAQQPAIGDQVTSMSFIDIRYLPRTLRDFGERRAYVLFTVTTTCPLAGRILPRVQRLADEHASDGVQFVRRQRRARRLDRRYGGGRP